jgi:hypothetical protein
LDPRDPAAAEAEVRAVIETDHYLRFERAGGVCEEAHSV